MDIKKLEKKLGRQTIDEMDAMSDAQLKQVIVEASTAMQTAKDELAANPNYQDLKLRLNDVTQAKKEVDGRQKARIAYSLQRLKELGQ